MSDHKKRKKSRKHDDHYDDKPKSSLVDYSKVSARPDGAPLRRSGPAEAPSVSTGPQLPPVGGAAAAPPKMSAQMEAVVRLMAGVEERTIAQKLADSNRPTWEQYKKDNEDRLNLDGLDQKKMDEYRRELDAERDKILARGTNHAKKKKKRKDDDDSSSSSISGGGRHRKKHRKKKDRKRRKHKRDHSDDSDSDSSDDERDRKRKKKSKKKKSSKKDGNDSGDESDGSHYRLSKFFNGASDSD